MFTVVMNFAKYVLMLEEPEWQVPLIITVFFGTGGILYAIFDALLRMQDRKMEREMRLDQIKWFRSFRERESLDNKDRRQQRRYKRLEDARNPRKAA